jgi:hypothetical protein
LKQKEQLQKYEEEDCDSKEKMSKNRSLKFEKSIETGFGYDVIVASLPTPSLSTTKKVVIVAGGVQIGLPEEQSIVDCA